MFKNIREEQERANERKLLEAKIKDQYQFAISKNKITHTDFLNMAEKKIAEKYLRENGIRNYAFFGGNGEESDRNILLFYSDKFSDEMLQKNYDKILCGIRIVLPKELHYEHRMYLSGIMKLGIRREKVGDILVRENGADILVLKEVAEILANDLRHLTRFQKAKIEIVSIQKIENKEKKFEDLSIIVSSMRLDNFVAELARCSRTKAVELINQQRVLVNYNLETKFSKKINPGDIINIRGKGKFVVGEIDHQTRSEKQVVKVKKFI